MDTFENFQSYDTASQYGGVPDDTGSIVSGYTESTKLKAMTDNLDSLSLDHYATASLDNHEGLGAGKSGAPDDDFDGVLDDFKEESAVDLPAHACRYV